MEVYQSISDTTLKRKYIVQARTRRAITVSEGQSITVIDMEGGRIALKAKRWTSAPVWRHAVSLKVPATAGSVRR